MQGSGRSGKTLLCVMFLVVASGCSNSPYTVTFNDNVLYSPNAALLDMDVADPALQGCINQALAGMENGTIEQVTALACPDAGIKSLEGLNTLTALEQLELSNNSIDNISALQPLRNLRVLSMRNNGLMNIGPLFGLPLLRFVSLEGNDRIPCRQLEDLTDKLGNTFSKPLSCVR